MLSYEDSGGDSGVAQGSPATLGLLKTKRTTNEMK